MTTQTQTEPRKHRSNRHDPNKLQVTAWIHKDKHAAFFEACRKAGTVPSAEIRAFIDKRIAAAQ